MRVRPLIAAALFMAAATPALAQRWRTLDASRQLRDTAPLVVNVQYAAGKLELRPAAAGDLYTMHLKYDADRSEPVSRYDSLSHTLSLGLKSSHMNWNHGDQDAGAMQAQLSARVPLDLRFEVGAVEGDVQLGGLRITDLSLKGGAAEVTLRFDAPNPVSMRTMKLDAGAESVKVVKGVNAATDRIRANVGVGALDLDFTGVLTHDLDVQASVALGDFTLRLSPDVGVFVDAKTFLGDLSGSGLVKRGDGWYTPDYEKATRHVRVRLRAFVGGFKLRRTTD